MPRVSIIMGVYNSVNTIENCINSILNQTYTDWEFIICDDCSTDNTYSFLSNLISEDKRFILLKNEKNLRLAASLNVCLKVATGEYIARMDADDESLPTRLEEQIAFLDSNMDCAVVGCNRIIFDESGDIGIRKSIERPTKNLLIKDTPFAHPTIIMRKKVYEDLKGYTVAKETMRAEDLDLWFRFYEKGYIGYNIQKPLYRYHESHEDYKKRTLKAAIETSRVYISGYKKIGIPFYKNIFAIKPIISALLPVKIIEHFHLKKLDRR